ncbi:hypothetical protein KCV06_g133, partial [Aureobasidium melanogenum]
MVHSIRASSVGRPRESYLTPSDLTKQRRSARSVIPAQGRFTPTVLALVAAFHLVFGIDESDSACSRGRSEVCPSLRSSLATTMCGLSTTSNSDPGRIEAVNEYKSLWVFATEVSDTSSVGVQDILLLEARGSILGQKRRSDNALVKILHDLIPFGNVDTKDVEF